MNPENAQLNSSSRVTEFIQSVLQLRPRLAVFDCDGTLWSGDAGFGFFEWELNRGLVSDDVVRWARARYTDYLAGKVSEDDMCAEMVTMNRGLPESDMLRAAEEFFEAKMLNQLSPVTSSYNGLSSTFLAAAADAAYFARHKYTSARIAFTP